MSRQPHRFHLTNMPGWRGTGITVRQGAMLVAHLSAPQFPPTTVKERSTRRSLMARGWLIFDDTASTHLTRLGRIAAEASRRAFAERDNCPDRSPSITPSPTEKEYA